MPLVVPVKFTYASRDLWFDPQDLDILKGDYAICSTERGTEIGLVTADPFGVPKAEIGQPLKPVLRVATDVDLNLADDLAIQGEDAMADFRRLVKQNKLEMKPVGVEYLFGGEKAVFYFAAEDRVDFRQLVKDLSSTFHIRVDMRQIGVRDETRLVGGYAQCGQELCCARFGGQFEPVSIRMAKEQDLPLNSSKISGVCGRLMCCLRYEFEAYKDFKSRAPKKKTIIDTPLGKARIQEYDTPREQLVLRLENGKVFKVNLSDMTCSEGCKKKAAEQGCNCRPDCVTRDVLERIESPEMKLALMELDRENGVDVGDGLASADRLAGTATPKRRRTRDGEGGGRGNDSQGHGRGRGKGAEPTEPAGDASSSRRRRKRGTSTVDTAEGQGRGGERGESHEAQQQARGGGMNPTRRRRRHLSSEERDDAFRAAAAREAQPGRGGAEGGSGERPSKPRGGRDEGEGAPRQRRRRHTTTSQQKPATPSVADQVSDGEVKVTRRRPGDGGGAAAKSARAERDGRDERAGRGGRNDREPRGEHFAGNARGAEAGDASAADGQGQKRRRRRRSRKPRQDGGEGGQGNQGGKPSAPQGPAGE